jgi:hypothetical protein
MFVEALRLTERHTTLNKVFRYLALGLALLIIGGTLYAWIIIEGVDRSYIPRFARNILTASLIGWYYFKDMFARRRLLANLFHARSERTMQGRASIEGVEIGPKDGKKLFKWEQFVSKGDKGKIYALMTTDGSVAVFHKEFFATEVDWERFKQMARQFVIEPRR